MPSRSSRSGAFFVFDLAASTHRGRKEPFVRVNGAGSRAGCAEKRAGWHLTRASPFFCASAQRRGGGKDEGKTFQINAPGAPRRQTWSASCWRRSPCRARRMKCFWACDATCVGERLGVFDFDVRFLREAGGPLRWKRGRMEANSPLPQLRTHVITKVREISFQRPFPSEARPLRKARCSSAVQGDPSEAATLET